MHNSESLTLAVDAQGGDFGPSVTVPAALDALDESESLHIILTGRPAELEGLLKRIPPQLAGRISVQPAEHVIAQDARPVSILRKGEDSSLGWSLRLVADQQAQACVSAGNTVALVTLGIKLLGCLPGIRRPALMSHIPSARGFTSMLDLGINLNVDAAQLLQFAVMGSVVRSALDGRPASIGLLNVGHEDSKGHAVVREAHELLQGSDLNYQGFIEGHDIFAGKVDVAVCDGFAGNLILKASEGLAGMLLSEVRQSLQVGILTRIGAALVRPALGGMVARLDPAKHNGAPLLGLNNVLIKSHGNASRLAFKQAILEAVRETTMNIPAQIGTMVSQNGMQEES